MLPGDVLEASIWLDGTEPSGMQTRWEVDLHAHLAMVAAKGGKGIGPLRSTVLKPGDERVPDVPDHIQGPDVRLLVCEAMVIEGLFCAAHSFVTDLEEKDLLWLRALTRSEYEGKLTDQQCDEIIDALGPETAARTLEQPIH